MAREVERTGHAATELRTTSRDPDVAELHPVATELVEERSRHKQRLEKLLEDALIKLSSVATDLLGVSSRAMIEALIAGERDPKVLADLARGKLNAKRGALLEALNGRFDDHHADIARVLLDQIDACTDKVDRLTVRIEALVAGLPDPPPPGGREHVTTLNDVGSSR